MAELIPDISKGLQFHEPTPKELHLRMERLTAIVIRLNARVTELETQLEEAN